jgi:hypothetical protein
MSAGCRSVRVAVSASVAALASSASLAPAARSHRRSSPGAPRSYSRASASPATDGPVAQSGGAVCVYIYVR